MDKSELVVGKTYETTGPINACLYDPDPDILDCLLPDMIELFPGTQLTFVEHDADSGSVFQCVEGGELYCLHTNDLGALKEA